jgi:chromosome segregation ATPase
MQDSSLNQNRLDDLINTISEAKRSLNNWQDKRTEALIRLDSFTYDIQMIGEEKKRNADALTELKNEIQSQAKVYQSHVSDLTDEMQLLKLENENLRNEVLDKNLNIESMIKEIENQRLMREQQAKLSSERLQEVRMEAESKAEQMIEEYKTQNDFLNVKVVEMARLKAETEMRAERLEREIVQIRSHMLNVLEVNQSGFNEKKKPVANPAAQAAPVYNSDGSLKTTPATEVSMQEVKKLRAVEIEPDSVEDYLKRLGY